MRYSGITLVVNIKRTLKWSLQPRAARDAELRHGWETRPLIWVPHVHFGILYSEPIVSGEKRICILSV